MVVLIVEDEILVGMELQMTLRMAGHQVGEPASSAEQALRVASIWKAGPKASTLPASYATGTTPPCVFLTARPEKVNDAHDAAVGVITKPYDPATVVGAVKFAAAIRTGGDRTASAPSGLELFH